VTPTHPPRRSYRAAQIEIRAGRGEGQALRTKEGKLSSRIPAGRALAVAFASLPPPQWPTVDSTNITAAATPVCQRASDSFVGARPSGQGRTPGDIRCGAGLLARGEHRRAESTPGRCPAGVPRCEPRPRGTAMRWRARNALWARPPEDQALPSTPIVRDLARIRRRPPSIQSSPMTMRDPSHRHAIACRRAAER